MRGIIAQPPALELLPLHIVLADVVEQRLQRREVRVLELQRERLLQRRDLAVRAAELGEGLAWVGGSA